MAQIIKPKRGTTTPTTSNLVAGEIAIDTSAQKLYVNDAGTVKEIGGGTSVTVAQGNFDIEPIDAAGVSVTSVETNRCRYFRVGNRCQVDIYANKITKGSVSSTSPVRFRLPTSIPQPRATGANAAPDVLGVAQIMGVGAPDHGVWIPKLTYGTRYMVFEGVGTNGQARVDPDIMLWSDVIGVGGPTSNWTEWYISLQYEV